MRSECLLAVLLVMAAPANAAELVIDGGFDDPAHPAWDFEQFDLSSTIAWSATDAAGASASGSLSLRKTLGEFPNSLRAAQCIDFVPGAEYEIGGTLFWPSASTEGSPFIAITFQTGAGCVDASPGGANATIGFPPRDVWHALAPTVIQVPPDARSGRLYVGVSGVIVETSPDFFEASWDDVSIVPEPGAAGAGAALTALGLRARRRARR
jgi:hypothetical protein